MKIAIGSDHGGYELRGIIMKHLEERGFEYEDLGCYNTDSCDYPDYGIAVGNKVASGECDCGIAICGSGNGISMTLNKHQGVRAALCWTPELGALAKQHNNANVLSLPGRFISLETAQEIVKAYFAAEFEGGRHQRRVEKIPCK